MAWQLTCDSNFSQEIFIWDCTLTKAKHKSEITFLPTLGYAKYLRSPLLSPLKLLQKVPRNRRQKFVDTRFSHKLGFWAKIWRPWENSTGWDTFVRDLSYFRKMRRFIIFTEIYHIRGDLLRSVKVYHILGRCGQSLIVWWCSVCSDIRCHKGKQAAITLMFW